MDNLVAESKSVYKRRDKIMKRVLVLTYQSLDNYGQRLQNYAVENILKEYNLNPESGRIIFTNKKRKNVIRRLYGRFSTKGRVLQRKYKLFAEFNNKYLNVVEIYSEKIEYEHYDYVATGSDQIWNPYIPQQELELFFLKDVNRSKRILMSPSLGFDDIPSFKEELFVNLLKCLDHYVIREETGKKEIERLTGNTCLRLMDPTLYFSYKKYDDIENISYVLPQKKYVLYFCLGKTNDGVLDKLNQFAKKKNLMVINIGKLNAKKETVVGPCEWISLVKHAEMVVSNSFHGIVFSIIYHKSFFAFERVNNLENVSDTRVKQLLKLFEIEEGRYKNFNFDAEMINYEKVECIRQREKDKWNKYLAERL